MQLKILIITIHSRLGLRGSLGFNQILIEKHSWRNSRWNGWRECMVMACMVIVRQIIGIKLSITYTEEGQSASLPGPVLFLQPGNDLNIDFSNRLAIPGLTLNRLSKRH